jgi:hypothetical protein
MAGFAAGRADEGEHWHSGGNSIGGQAFARILSGTAFDARGRTVDPTGADR